MKVLITCLVLIIHAPVRADFNAATEAYHNQQFAEAFQIYDQLARIGNERAQYNLAVMYLKGEHVQQNLNMAYAWGKLSTSGDQPEYAELIHAVKKQLDESNLLAAEQQYEALNDKYGAEKIFTKLSPVTYQSSTKRDTKKPYQIKSMTRKAPRYPKEAFNDRIQGWVTVSFEIHPDGTARNLYVLDAYPENVFENATIKAVEKFKFDIVFDTGIDPYVTYARQTIEFSLEKVASTSKLRKYYNERLNKLKELAQKGHAESQYLYALAASSNLINKENKMPDQEVNQWWFKAAQNGHLEAQYQLGTNLLCGVDSETEKQKGVDWIVYAAEQGHAKSSRKAYHLLTKNKYLNNTNKPPEYWLKIAADNGDADSQLDYAEFLVKQHGDDSNQLIGARHYLEGHANHRDKSVKWYLVSAQIYTRQGNEKMAKSHQKKANKLAKKLGWRLDSDAHI